jgi:hypothetical protein
MEQKPIPTEVEKEGDDTAVINVIDENRNIKKEFHCSR